MSILPKTISFRHTFTVVLATVTALPFALHILHKGVCICLFQIYVFIILSHTLFVFLGSIACYNDASMEVISYLTQKWPESIRETDNDGRTPLHYAYRDGASMEVISYLTEEWPSIAGRACRIASATAENPSGTGWEVSWNCIWVEII